jgi:hypothetical protein
MTTEAVERVVAGARVTDAALAARVQAVATATREWLASQVDPARASLAQAIQHAEQVGAPPLITRALGWPDWEKPQNRLLGWILDPSGDHGAGTAALAAFAELVGLPSIAVGDVEVRRETGWPAGATGKREPDLLIISANAAILMENKVGAPESGDGQYRDYLDGIRALTSHRGISEWRIVLSARGERQMPADWRGESNARVVRHVQIAEAFEQAAGRRAGWARISCLLCARQLRHEPSLMERLPEARRLLQVPNPGPADIARMQLLADQFASTPALEL